MCLLGLMMKPDCNAEIKAYGDEEEIWEYLVDLTPNEQIAAGIMGFFYRESRLKADAVAGWDVREEGICEKFVKEVDGGMNEEEFIQAVQDFGGFGLGQWMNHDYLSDLYNFMFEEQDFGNADSIADVKGQCEFAVWSLQQNEELWSELLKCTTAIQCGRRIGIYYDGTSAEGAEAIAGFAQYYYERMVNDDV